jgi:hypothetical protein
MLTVSPEWYQSPEKECASIEEAETEEDVIRVQNREQKRLGCIAMSDQALCRKVQFLNLEPTGAKDVQYCWVVPLRLKLEGSTIMK